MSLKNYGPIIEPNHVKQAVLLLHGYGSDGDNLIELGQSWQAALPDTLFFAPNAPDRHEGGFGGYQWFSLMERNVDHYIAGLKHASIFLADLLTQVQTTYQLDNQQIALMGFSQGAMLSLYYGLRQSASFAGILAYSGALQGAEQLAAEIQSKPPVQLIHGSHDDVVPHQYMIDAEKTLTALDVPVNAHTCQNLYHSIDYAGMQLGQDFLARLWR